MKLFKLLKDGGPMSRVWAYVLIEWKRLFSIILLRFDDGSREAYHTHAFNAVSWVLRGRLEEHELGKPYHTVYTPSLRPIFTPRGCFHKVVSEWATWVLTFRGPWSDQWKEFIPDDQSFLTLTHGRHVVAKEPA